MVGMTAKRQRQEAAQEGNSRTDRKDNLRDVVHATSFEATLMAMRHPNRIAVQDVGLAELANRASLAR